MKRLAALVVAYLVGCAAAGAWIVDRALRPPRVPVTDRDRVAAERVARETGSRIEDVSLTSADGTILRGWVFTPSRMNGHSAVVLHGTAGNRADVLTDVQNLLRDGYLALAVDARAQGESEGVIATFGALETGDNRRWIAWLRNDRPDGCVYLIGGSLGASAALQVSDAAGVCGIVARSAFASFREIAFDRIGQQVGTSAWLGRTLARPGVDFGFLYVRLRHDVDLRSASALDSIARPGAPVLLIHGDADNNVPPRHARLLQASNPTRVTLWLVSGGSHEGLGPAATAEYPARTLGFLASHRRPFR